MEKLLELPGVGRKTANVVLGNAFGKDEGFVVDTHVGRLSRRLGFTRQTDPVKVEEDLNALVPRGRRTMGAHLLIAHGRHDLLRPQAALRRVPGRPAVPENRRVERREVRARLTKISFPESAAENPVKIPAESLRKRRKRPSRAAICTDICAIEEVERHQRFSAMPKRVCREPGVAKPAASRLFHTRKRLR